MLTRTTAEPLAASERYDVVVVGGGAAGLSGALLLGRSRRSVLVVDAGEPRNAAAAHAHGFLTRDGMAPGELLELGRAEVRGYGGEVLAGRVMSAVPAPGGGFTVELAGGRTVQSRRLLVTTGLVDELPAVPGVRERWGRDVLHCPYCHGWEVRDQAIGILGSGPLAVHQALMLGQWTSDVTLLVHTAPQLTEAQREQLSARGVSVVDGEVTELEITGDQLTAVRLTSGTTVPCQAVMVSPRVVARAGVLESLGLATSEHPMGIGSHVAADPTGLTAVPGVWVAGNITDPNAPIIGAAAAGSRAAMAINADLIAEDVQQAVNTGRSRSSAPSTGEHAHHGHDHLRDGLADLVMDEAYWDERYQSSSALWSGNPNPQLVTEAAELAPGTALDVGCGEGADAIWLAEHGWRVTAVDISIVALERGAAHARDVGPDVVQRITWVHADLTDWLPAPAAYDLVSAHFVHAPKNQHEFLHRRLAASVAPGGTLLIVGHHPSDLQTTVPRPPVPELYFTASDVAASLDTTDWVVVVDAARARQTLDPDGRATTIHDAVFIAQRTG